MVNNIILPLACLIICTMSQSPTCLSPLGLSDGTVKDNQLRASSSFSASTVGALNGRLGTERGGGAWCPAGLVSEETGLDEWLEIDLGRELVVTGIITQGRFAGGQGQEFAEFVSILVWGGDGEGWRQVSDRETASKVIKANEDTHSKVEIVLEEPVLTKVVRIVPVSKHPRMVCLRLELLGCRTKDGQEIDDGDDQKEENLSTHFKKKESEAFVDYKRENPNKQVIYYDDSDVMEYDNILASDVYEEYISTYYKELRVTSSEGDKSDNSHVGSNATPSQPPSFPTNYPTIQEPPYMSFAVGVLVTVIVSLILAITFILFKNLQYGRKYEQQTVDSESIKNYIEEDFSDVRLVYPVCSKNHPSHSENNSSLGLNYPSQSDSHSLNAHHPYQSVNQPSTLLLGNVSLYSSPAVNSLARKPSHSNHYAATDIIYSRHKCY